VVFPVGNILEDAIGMTDPSWRKILSLATIALLLVTWGGGRLILSTRFVISNHHLSFFVDVPPWLGIGALTRSTIHPHTRMKQQGCKEFFETFILAWVLIGLFWFLPAGFPSLQLIVHGIEINLLKNPLVLLISIAFLLGFFMQLVVRFSQFVRKKVSASLIAFFRGNSGSSLHSFLEGIKKILFPSIPA
jgi:hypothetical protein